MVPRKRRHVQPVGKSYIILPPCSLRCTRLDPKPRVLRILSNGILSPCSQISFGLWLVGAFDWVRLVCVIPAQILGGITAAGLVSGILPRALQAENGLGPGVSQVQGFLMETVLTSMPMITILMLAVEKHRASFMAPMIIGVALLIIHLVGTFNLHLQPLPPSTR